MKILFATNFIDRTRKRNFSLILLNVIRVFIYVSRFKKIRFKRYYTFSDGKTVSKETTMKRNDMKKKEGDRKEGRKETKKFQIQIFFDHDRL